MAKASMEELNNLHDAVAKELSKGLDDPKTLALAIKFLKDNSITVDIQESKETKNLFTIVQEMKTKPSDKASDPINSLLEDYM